MKLVIDALKKIDVRERIYSFLTISRLLLKEIWLALILAVGWTIYTALEDGGAGWQFTALVKTFAPTFFFCSWLPSQLNRVRKTKQTETGLKNIQVRLQDLVDELDGKIKVVLGYLTGGDSFCRFVVLDKGGMPGGIHQVLLSHSGEYHFSDVRVIILDLAAQDAFFSKVAPNTRLDPAVFNVFVTSYGPYNLSPNTAQILGNIQIPSPQGDFIKMRIDFRMKAADLSQMLYIYVGNGSWASATYVTKIEGGKNALLFEQIESSYPESAAAEFKAMIAQVSA